MHPDTHLALHHIRAAHLRNEADTYRLAKATRHPRDLRTRLGWTLIEVGLRMATAPQPAAVIP